MTSSNEQRLIGLGGRGLLSITINNGGSGTGNNIRASVPVPPSVSNVRTSAEAASTTRTAITFTSGESSEEFIKKLENFYKAHRMDILERNGYITTPLAVLNNLATASGHQVHTETHELKYPDNSSRYLVEVMVEKFVGLGEANRLKVARQIAAADLLEKAKLSGEQLPPYGLVPGACGIGPSVFAVLLELCSSLELAQPIYIEIPFDIEHPNGPLYTVKCQIGRLFVLGYSDSPCLAKRWAAKQMFETLTGQKYPMESVSHGSNCIAFQQHGLIPRVSTQKHNILNLSMAELSGIDDDEIVHTLQGRSAILNTLHQTGRISELRNQFKDFSLE